MNNQEGFEQEVEMDDVNTEDFSDLWDEEQIDDERKEAGNDDTEPVEEGEEEFSTDEGEDETEPESEEEEGNGDDEEDSIELELVENADEELVSAVQTLVSADQLYLSEDQIKTIFNGTEESYQELLSANKKAADNMAIENIYNWLPERGKGFFDYLVQMKGEGDLDGWLALEAKASDLMQYDTKSLTEAQAKEIVRQEHNKLGISEKQSRYIIEGLEDSAELIDEGKNIIKNNLAEIEKAKADKLANDKAAQLEAERQAAIKYNMVVNEIKATKLPPAKQSEIHSLLYDKYQGSSNTKLVDMIINIVQNKPAQLIQLAQLFDGYSDKEGFDLKRLKKQIASDTTRKVKKTIKRKTKDSPDGGKSISEKQSRTGGDIEAWLSDVEL